MVVRDLPVPAPSAAPDPFRGAPAEFRGPDVMSPVVGRTGGMGPELCLEVGIPPPCGPEDFLIGSPCLFKGPELAFFIDDEPEPAPDEPIRLPEFDDVWLE
ncbi:hypothetical protein HanRHA438_Chr05g0211581 [Helianthus annuus]|nr:hypothetical protein HanIR_Chr05g0217671 [Helianthus annuus]KAJ0917918.1 hypothetical protein HanRHA438_Chr05g0211581 [Helianthus annuus]